MRRHVPSRKVYRMLGKWDTSLTRQGMAQKLGVPLGTIQNLQRNYGLKCQSKRSLVHQAHLKLYHSNITIREFAKSSGLSYLGARNFLVNNHLPYVRARNLIEKQNLNYYLVALLQSHGFTYESIGRLYKVSRQRIEQVLKKKLR